VGTVTLTEGAVREIKRIMAEQNTPPDKVYVRAGVRGGGCSGFTWVFNLDEEYNEKTDTVEEQDGLRLVIDKRSAMYLAGTTIDFLEALDKRGFKFDNPAITHKCGCGSSFSP
jgi:iron-sulfur cluster assembly protein